MTRIEKINCIEKIDCILSTVLNTRIRSVKTNSIDIFYIFQIFYSTVSGIIQRYNFKQV